ncbi:MAG: hypothetical protein JNL10_05650 [Verrucomicrobiales bacterium]|nr:hypothetical protein [Verrucomicrobiales bacterium]
MEAICDAYSLVPGHERWGGIALAVSCPGDVVQMHPSLRPLEPAVRAHYDRCGLPVAETILWDDGYHALEAAGRDGISVSMFGNEVHRRCPDARWRTVVDRFQDKNAFVVWARGFGAPVPRTVCVPHGRDARNHGLAYPVFLKDAVSLAGLGIDRCMDELDLADAIRWRVDPFQIQEALPPGTAFLNAQYLGSDAGCDYVTTTRQILDGWSHRGNSWPEPVCVRKVTDPIAHELVRLGMRGIFGFDVAVAGYPDLTRVWVLECNPRWNGSSYFWFPAQKLGAKAWTGLVVSCPADFNSMDLGELEFRPASGEGIVLVDWTRTDSGSASVLVVGTPERQRDLLRGLSSRPGWALPAQTGAKTDQR